MRVVVVQIGFHQGEQCLSGEKSDVSEEEWKKADPAPMTTLCLDTEIIPSKYGKALLHVMYMDSLDMRMVHEDQVSSRYQQHHSMFVTPAPPHHAPPPSLNSTSKYKQQLLYHY